MGLLFWHILTGIRLPCEVFKSRENVFSCMFVSVGHDVFGWRQCNPNSKQFSRKGGFIGWQAWLDPRRSLSFWREVLSCELALFSGSKWWVHLQTSLSLRRPYPWTGTFFYSFLFGRLSLPELDRVSKQKAITMSKGMGYADWLDQVTCSPSKAG